MERGAEFYLIEICDVVRSARYEGESIIITSIDVGASFDAVPHEAILKELEELDPNEHACRYPETWLTERELSLRLQRPAGVFNSRYFGITGGLPQRGIISPCLWLIYFNSSFQP